MTKEATHMQLVRIAFVYHAERVSVKAGARAHMQSRP